MKMKNDKFAVFILSHGRADQVVTYNTLRKHGYTGQIYLLVDDQDKQQNKYKKIYGDQVVVFPKEEAAKITDACDNFTKRNTVLYARNWSFKIAKDLGLQHFWQLDDDYTSFRWASDNERKYVGHEPIKNMDEVLDICIDFLDESKAHCVAWAQGGDFIGGENGAFAKKIRLNQFSRKIMNSFLFNVDRPIKFMGRMNDDVNTYLERGKRGYLFITIPRLRLEQKPTQQNAGGLTEMYLDFGTYVKSFYSVMVTPSCVKVMDMGQSDRRIHHKVTWKYACPVILDESRKKQAKASSIKLSI